MKLKTLTIIFILSSLVAPLNTQKHLLFSRTEGKPNAGGFMMGELIIKEAYRRLGYRIELKEYPAERAISVANNGSTDGNLQRSAGAEKQYTNLVMIPFPIIYNEHVVFTKHKAFKVNGYNSLKSYSIVIFLGNKPTKRGTRGMKITAVASPEQAFMMLESGRADVFIYPREGICIAKKLGLKNIKVLEPPVEKSPIFHYLNKRHGALVPQLLKVLKKMEKEGVIQRFQQESLIELRKNCY